MSTRIWPTIYSIEIHQEWISLLIKAERHIMQTNGLEIKYYLKRISTCRGKYVKVNDYFPQNIMNVQKLTLKINLIDCEHQQMMLMNVWLWAWSCEVLSTFFTVLLVLHYWELKVFRTSQLEHLKRYKTYCHIKLLTCASAHLLNTFTMRKLILNY